MDGEGEVFRRTNDEMQKLLRQVLEKEEKRLGIQEFMESGEVNFAAWRRKQSKAEDNPSSNSSSE